MYVGGEERGKKIDLQYSFVVIILGIRNPITRD